MRKSALLPTEIDLGARSAPLVVRVNRRARRLIVRVDEINGRVLVTAPSRRALPDAIRFAKSRAPWILKRFQEGVAARPFAGGVVFPYRGEPHRLVHDGPSRAPTRLERDPPRLVIGGAPEHVNRRAVDFLKRAARTALEERATHYAERLHRRITRLAIRDGRSRWGSCTREGALSFSWRLILAPPEILDYVAAHECAHLVHLDHSRAYWTTLEGLGVDARAARAFFEANGAALHAFGANGV